MSDLFNTRLEKALEILAPLTTKSVVVRRKVPWFTQEVKDQKRKLRKSEKIWRKNKSKENWINLKLECMKYNILKSSKVQSISKKVIECEHDIKKMYRLINNITGRTSENPVPENVSDETHDFANFFMDKVQKICDKLQQYDKYTPTRNTNFNILSSFREMTKDKVIKIIAKMSPKSCELDAIPSSLLKGLVTDLAPTVTKLVNTSLTTGRFASNLKTLIIRPLLKKLGLELLLANYRPVSNLSFISKLVEKCALK